MKPCIKCKEPKLPKDFYSYSNECKVCKIERSKARYRKKRDEIRAKEKIRYNANRDWILEQRRKPK